MTDFESAARGTRCTIVPRMLRLRPVWPAVRGDGCAGAVRRCAGRPECWRGLVVVAPFLFLRGEPEGPGIATDPSPPSATTSATDDGLRTESWHDVTFEVPDDWGSAARPPGAPSGRSPEDTKPTVGRPSDMVPLILCDPGRATA